MTPGSPEQEPGRRDPVSPDAPGHGWTTSRRSVLRAGALAGLAAAGGLAASTVATEPAARVRYVVADRRLRESLTFARVLQERGAERLDVTDGLTRLWRERLAPHWRNPQGVVAGLTSQAVWDCLSQQAGDHFRKARLLGRHVVVDRAGAADMGAGPILAARDACAGFPGRGRECLTYPGPSKGLRGQVLVSWMIG